MNVLSLFAGIGGLELGLERAGMTVVGQVELDPFCREVLAKHWPEVPRHDDVRTTVEWWRGAVRPAVDVVCGGFPCQPVSLAGRGLAQEDERWLWPAFAAVLRDLRPRYAILENVTGLLGRGAGVVLGDLAEIGYDAEWDCVPAATVGAPHRRDRWFCVAYPNGLRRTAAAQHRVGAQPGQEWQDGQSRDAGARPRDVADADNSGRDGRPRIFGQGRRGQPAHRDWWAAEPDVGRVANGIPGRVDRLKGLGNAVVPHVTEHIGRLVMEAT
ncbi:MAG: DNA cytosine methyltransferase [Nocardioidaceae bacterium]